MSPTHRPSDSSEATTLLGAVESAKTTVSLPKAEPAAVDPDASSRLPNAGFSSTPENVPGYRIVRLVASGGMGSVYEAEQLNPRRRVALKVVKPGMASAELLRRFEFEARALAQLDHPGVARIYQAGTFDSGTGPQPFFAMEFVDGPPLDRWAAEKRLPTRARIELMARVCDAVEHAHQKGIIHRDLKPGNILVVDDGAGSGSGSGLQGIGQPKVLDFGLARATDADVQTVSMLTEAGQLLGTVRYMSPEQATGHPEAVDTRSDVYSLGVVAYELLTGRHPQSIANLMMIDTLRVLRDEDPTPAGSVDPTLRGDVETILGKALEKERARRYGSASDLAADLRRYLEHEPIAARPPSAGYQFAKFARRNRAVVVGAACVFLALWIGMSAALWQAGVARNRARAAEYEQYVGAIQFAQSAIRDRRFRIAEEVLLKAPPSLRNWEWGRVMREAHPESLALVGHSGQLNSAAFSPDGSRVVTASTDATAKLWDARSGRELATLSGHGAQVNSAAFSPEGARIVTASVDGTARVWDAATGGPLATLSGHSGVVTTARFSPDGSRIVTASADHSARIWDAKTGRELLALAGHFDWVRSAVYSPDGSRIASASHDGTARSWDASTGRSLATFSDHEGRVNSVAISPDGASVVTASADATARIWDASNGQALATLSGHSAEVDVAAFSPDGSRVVTASLDRTARVWDSATGEGIATLSGHSNRMDVAIFSPDGSRILTASWDTTARLWDPTTGRETAVLAGHSSGISAAFSADGSRVVTASSDGTAKIWEVGFARDSGVLAEHADRASAVAFAPDDARIVTASADGVATIRDLVPGEGSGAERKVAHALRHSDGVNGVAFSPEGSRVVTASSDGTARIWETMTGRVIAVLTGHDGTVNACAFSPDGSRVITASSDRTAKVWKAASASAGPGAATGEVLATLSGHSGAVNAAAFSPDGSRIVTASSDKSAKIWNAESGRELLSLWGQGAQLTAASFSPDGSRVVTASADHTARIWDADTGAPIATLAGHSTWVNAVAFSPDGSRLVTGSSDATAKVWDAATGRELATLTGHAAEVNAVAFSRDGTRVATASSDRTVVLWDTCPWDADEFAPSEWPERLRLWQAAGSNR